MSYVGAVILVIGFIVLIKYLKVIEKSTKVLGIAKQSVEIIKDKSISDLQKETTLQKYSKQLLLLFLAITAGSLLALLLPFSLIWLLEFTGLLSVNAVIATSLTWEFILGSIAVSIPVFWIISRKNDKIHK